VTQTTTFVVRLLSFFDSKSHPQQLIFWCKHVNFRSGDISGQTLCQPPDLWTFFVLARSGENLVAFKRSVDADHIDLNVEIENDPPHRRCTWAG